MSNKNNSAKESSKIPEKEENVKIYDNDDAYMLNDDNDGNECQDNYMYDQEEGQELGHNNGEENEYRMSENEGYNENGNEVNQEMYDLEEGKEYLEANMEQKCKQAISEDDTVRNKLEPVPASEHIEEQDPVRQSSSKKKGNSATKEQTPAPEDDSQQYPLITLKYLSVCQCCKESFNSSNNIPYLLKCGHFFCKVCLEKYFTDDSGIHCPNDGLMAKSLFELKLLGNLINDKMTESTDRDIRHEGFCEVHKNQKLSHYIEDTREVICVYCAFNKFKKNPKYEIKEIKDKCKEVTEDINKVLEDNQQYVEQLQVALKEIKSNKENEQERVSVLYNQVINYLQDKKKKTIESIDDVFMSNAAKLSEMLDFFSNKIEAAEVLKASVNALMNKETSQVNAILDKFHHFLRDASDPSKNNLEIQEIRFSHDEESKLFKYLNNFGDLKNKTKYLRFSSTINREIPGVVTRDMGNLNINRGGDKSLDSQLKNLNSGVGVGGNTGSSGIVSKKVPYEGNYKEMNYTNEGLSLRNESQSKPISKKNYLIGDELGETDLNMKLGGIASLNKSPSLKVGGIGSMNRGDIGVTSNYSYNRNIFSGPGSDFAYESNKGSRDKDYILTGNSTQKIQDGKSRK